MTNLIEHKTILVDFNSQHQEAELLSLTAHLDKGWSIINVTPVPVCQTSSAYSKAYGKIVYVISKHVTD